MLKAAERKFLERQRVAHFATADRAGQPHVVPICFAVVDDVVYFSIDQKPKRHQTRPLKRIENILDNPKVSLVIDRYDEDWQRLAWIMLKGVANVLTGGDEHAQAQWTLKKRYPQLTQMNISALAVIKIRITKVTSWGAINNEEP